MKARGGEQYENSTIEILFKMQPEIDKMGDRPVEKEAAINLDDWINVYNNYDLAENEEGELCNGDGEKLEGIDYDKYDMMGSLLDLYFDDTGFRQ